LWPPFASEIKMSAERITTALQIIRLCGFEQSDRLLPESSNNSSAESREESILNLCEVHECGASRVIIRHVIDPSAGGTFSTVLFLTMQLLREVCANAHFFDGMNLSVQEVCVPFFILQHALK